MGSLNFQFGVWDLLLLVSATLLGTAVAYIRAPRMKAFALLMPLPFSFASLSLGREVDATNVIGVFLLYVYALGVKIGHRRLGLPIVASILLSALAYAVVARGLATVVPKTELCFWLTAGLVLAAGVVLHVTAVDRDEPGHRTSLPVWVKLPAIFGVVAFIVVMKLYLQGFMTMFPIVSLIAAYEARHSLGTICRKTGSWILAMVPMMAAMRIAETRFGLGIGPALLAGWVVFFAFLLPMNRHVWQRKEVRGSDRDAGVASEAS